MKKAIAAILTLLVLLTLCPSVFAQTIKTDMPCNLSLHYVDENDQPIPNLGVRLYRAADLTESGEKVPTASFVGYFEALKNTKSAVEKAARLADLVRRDQLKADFTARTDSVGDVSFSELPTGEYLILSDTVTDDYTVLNTQPLLLQLPMIDERSGVYAYDVTASPKPERTKIERTLNLIVIWRDEQNRQKRPDSVTVELYCDGKLFDTQKITAENGWRYTWTDILDKELTASGAYKKNDSYSDATSAYRDHPIIGEHSWYVIERGADGYTVTYAVRPENNTFIVINTLDVKPTEPTLPQTGQLWWPVPILAVCGLLMVVLGRKRKAHE